MLPDDVDSDTSAASVDDDVTIFLKHDGDVKNVRVLNNVKTNNHTNYNYTYMYMYVYTVMSKN